MKYYTGIGSRETPKEVLDLFEEVAAYLSKTGYTLRSGHADGADMAFETGCGDGDKEIYLPWDGFNGSDSDLTEQDAEAFQIAKQFHPNWDNLSWSSRKFHARNVYQVLGKDLHTPSEFVICWTKGGKKVGGTAQAIRIAEHYDIPVCNIGIKDNIDDMVDKVYKFIDFMNTMSIVRGK